MGRRTQTVRNPNHPRNMMNEVGNQTKKAVRKLSNEELDETLSGFLAEKNPDKLSEVLAMPRNKKIKFLADCSKFGFVEEWNAAQKAAAEAAKAEKDEEKAEGN